MQSSTHPNNLPAVATSFVGRQTEIQEVSALLDHDVRLITLSGPGGSGKTRLAREIGHAVLEHYPQGVWFVDIAPISDPDLVLPAIAHACPIEDDWQCTALELMSRCFGKARALLILDNFEQVKDASDDVVSLMLLCPDLQVLVTSRVLLRVEGEREYPVHALSLSESRVLFETRARQTSPSFAVTEENRLTVDTLCDRFERIPLALELASARLRFEEIEAIGTSLRTTMALNLSAHHSVPATVASSYDLLNAGEKRLFRTLGVFLGSFTAEAADWVCRADTREMLMNLQSQGLLIAPDANGRYRMVESLRQYAQELLVEAEEASMARKHHLDWYLKLAQAAAIHYRSSEQARWLDFLAIDHDNLRAALDWSAQFANTITQGLELAAALGYFWEIRGYFREGSRRLEKLLRLSSGQKTAAHARALNVACHLVWYRGEFAGAERYHQECLKLCKEISDRPLSAQALANLGDIAYARGDYAQAFTLQSKVLSLYRETGDVAGEASCLTSLGNIRFNQGDYEGAKSHYIDCSTIAVRLKDERLQAFALNNLGMLEANQQHYTKARELREQSLALFRKLKDRQGEGLVLLNLAGDCMTCGDSELAKAHYQESLRILSDVGDYRMFAFAVEGLSALVTVGPDINIAAEVVFCAAAKRLREEIRAPLPQADQNDFDCRMEEAMALLGNERFDREWAIGSRMSIEEIIAYVCSL